MTAASKVLELLKGREVSCRTLRFELREAGFPVTFEGYYTMMADLIRTFKVYRRDLPKRLAPGFAIQQPHFRLPEFNISGL